MIDQCISQALDDYDSVKVGDLIKITPVLGASRNRPDYYLIVDIVESIDRDNKLDWKALHGGKLVTFSGMTDAADNIVISRPS